jgi:hypothetical protein
MVLTVNVIIFLVTDLVVLYVVVMVHVTVVYANVSQDGLVNHAIVMLQMKHALWMVVMKYVLVVEIVNVVNVSVLKKTV